MGFEFSHGSKMQAVTCQDTSLKPLSSKGVSSRHRRSLSCPDKRDKEDDLGVSPQAVNCLKSDMGDVKECIDIKKKHSPVMKHQSSLKQEILQLERRLQDQFAVRQALEKALGYSSSSNDMSNENSMPRPTKELIKEIAVLELEVMYLEQHLLSLYRKAFGQQISSFSPAVDERLRTPSIPKSAPFLEVAELDVMGRRENSLVQSSQTLLPKNPVVSSTKESKDIGSMDSLIGPGVQRSHSELSQRSICSKRISPPMDSLDKALRTCHSQPLSFLEHTQDSTSNLASLAEHLGTRISDHIPETPNRLSEDVVRCMGAIYCKLAEPPLPYHGLSSSPSTLSSTSAFSPQDQFDSFSPHCRKDSSFDVKSDKPFKGAREFSGPYTTMVEVRWICRDDQRLRDAERMINNFRSLVHRLAKVDPRRMKNDEKLAFWINIHNALVMHAYLAYGIPQSSIKRGSLLVKAAYNVGGQTVSADTIQSSILGCRTQRAGQWLRTFFSPKLKFKAGDDRQSYTIEHPEPLAHFALCTGSYSDPAVRVYTAKRVFQDLDAAKEEFIQATMSLRKEQKLVLPKIIDSYAKDSGLCSSEIVEMVQYYLPESQRKAMQQCQQGKSRKSIEWLPHNFSFRYLLSKEIVK